jgi:hypothetical protein
MAADGGRWRRMESGEADQGWVSGGALSKETLSRWLGSCDAWLPVANRMETPTGPGTCQQGGGGSMEAIGRRGG